MNSKKCFTHKSDKNHFKISPRPPLVGYDAELAPKKHKTFANLSEEAITACGKEINYRALWIAFYCLPLQPAIKEREENFSSQFPRVLEKLLFVVGNKFHMISFYLSARFKDDDKVFSFYRFA